MIKEIIRNLYMITLPMPFRLKHVHVYALVHDGKVTLFDTGLDTPETFSVLENYVSRQEVNGGVDIGYDVGKKTFLVLGYRYGRQDQGRIRSRDSDVRSGPCLHPDSGPGRPYDPGDEPILSPAWAWGERPGHAGLDIKGLQKDDRFFHAGPAAETG